MHDQDLRGKKEKKDSVNCKDVKRNKRSAQDLKAEYDKIMTEIGPKLWACNVCSKQMTIKSELSRHYYRVHCKDDFKCICNVCGHKLRDNYKLKVHMFYKHDMKEDAGHACDYPGCNFKAFELSKLFDHKKRHLPKERKKKWEDITFACSWP
jgi:hypothetical protein